MKHNNMNDLDKTLNSVARRRRSKETGWISVSDSLPDGLKEVLVTDGYGSYAVAWCRIADGSWHAFTYMLEANNYDGGAQITLSEKVTHWRYIPEPPR